MFTPKFLGAKRHVDKLETRRKSRSQGQEGSN